MLIACYDTKKDCKAAIGKPLQYIETSAFGQEYKRDGLLTVAHRPHVTGRGREWFAQIVMKNGLIEKVS